MCSLAPWYKGREMCKPLATAISQGLISMRTIRLEKNPTIRDLRQVMA